MYHIVCYMFINQSIFGLHHVHMWIIDLSRQLIFCNQHSVCKYIYNSLLATIIVLKNSKYLRKYQFFKNIFTIILMSAVFSEQSQSFPHFSRVCAVVHLNILRNSFKYTYSLFRWVKPQLRISFCDKIPSKFFPRG